MPIQISCDCGKTLKVKDELAGKAVKCPGCGNVIRVGAASAPAAPKPTPRPKPAPTPAPAPTAVSAAGSMDDLFDEAGFSAHVAAVCPACKAEMNAGAVLCVKCGFHRETGESFESHKTLGVDIDHGTMALMKAESDLAEADQIQKDMESRAGMPWWMLALVLFMIGSATLIAVLAINASRAVDQNSAFDPVATFLILGGSAFSMVAIGAYGMIIIHAFKADRTKGILTALIPFYMIYYVFKNMGETLKYLIGLIVLGGIAGGMIGAGMSRL